MTIPMAIVDYIPVLLFLAAAVLLQRELYRDMSKGAFALFAGGTIMVVVAGCFKATWKLLYAAGVCDFIALNQAFFPMQATGFLLAGLGVLALVFHRQGTETACSVVLAPLVYESKLIFVVVLVLGTGAICGGLAALSVRRRKKGALVCFLVAFVLLMGMGYLSSRDFSQASMNWVAQSVNCAAQAAFLFGALLFRNTGVFAKNL